MEETERYIKIHDFLRNDLKLKDAPLVVFAFIFSIWSSGWSPSVWGAKYIADHTGLSTRSVKQAVKCLLGIGLIRRSGVGRGGAYEYEPSIPPCSSTTDAKVQLVKTMHRCKHFTGEANSPRRCNGCTMGGEAVAHKILIENISTTRSKSVEKKEKTGARIIDSISIPKRTSYEAPEDFKKQPTR